MKINAKGGVTFSVRNDDKDLSNFIESLPGQVGSDILRELIRDGLEYQKFVQYNKSQTSRFNMLCQLRRMDADQILALYYGEQEMSDGTEDPPTESDENSKSDNQAKTSKTKKVEDQKALNDQMFDDILTGNVTVYE